MVLVLAGVLAIGAHYRTLFGREAGVALLILFLALKQLELAARRDAMTVILLCFFLQLALFFEDQTPWMAAWMIGNLILVTGALIELTAPTDDVARTLRRAGIMMVQAVPFMLILFFLFPRVEGPLWGMPRDAFSARSGLSDSMSPGSISELSLSGALAFRVRFDGDAPPARQRYWRGPVLSRFDGRSWHVARAGSYERIPYALEGPPVSYTLTLEPHNRPWLFALDMPGQLPDKTVLTSDYQVLARQPVRARTQFAMVSHPLAAPGRTEVEREIRMARQLPAGRMAPRSRALAERWVAETRSPEALVQRALEYFRNEPFVYTLTPPLLGQDPIDSFIFESRRGFCEHYAAAFTFLMRAAGVPARVVTGYQGGEINPVDGYLLVRQSDAHAWAEVWLDGRGWTRVDPTAAVAPSRIERGLFSAVPEDDPLPLLARTDLSWLRSLRFRWEALSNTWDQWVLGYNTERQKEFLSRLGMQAPDWQSMAASMAVLTGLLTLALTGWTLRERLRLDPSQRAWRRLSRKLARVGLERRPGEGPLDYAERVRRRRPDLGDQVAAIASVYARLRYGSSHDPQLLQELRMRVSQLRLA